LLSFVGLARGHQAGPPRHGSGRRVIGVDVRLDGGDTASIQPGDESLHGFRGEPLPLPAQAHHPGDLGPRAAVRDGRLDVADRGPVGLKAHDPVPPFLAAIRGAPGGKPGIARPELAQARR
jgi:hypothetical protein